MTWVVLTGGTGGAKLIEGLVHEVDSAELTIICNTADDFVLHGLNIAPDIDTITYTVGGLSDATRGWGIRGDSFNALEQFERYGGETWFKLGDRDLATHITRTSLMRRGLTLSETTAALNRALDIRAAILPMSDQTVETRVATDEGELSFQEYFVKRRCQPEVRRVSYAGIEKSRAAPGVVDALREAAGVVFCPSNPITSIGPILAVPGIRHALTETAAPVVGMSPIIGTAAISGPADKLMAAAGWEVSAFGIATGYAEVLDGILIDSADAAQRNRIEALDIRVKTTSIRMDSLADKRRLARELLVFLKKQW